MEPISLGASSFSDQHFIILDTLTNLAAITEGENHSYIIAGTMNYNDYGLLKINNNGEKEWSNSYGGRDNDFVSDLISTSDNNLVMVGGSRSFTNRQNDVYVVKTTSQGSVIWSKNYGTTEVESGHNIYQTTDNDFIITANSSLLVHSYILKISSDGELIWSDIDNSTAHNTISSVLEMEDNTVLFGGTTLKDNEIIIELSKRNRLGEVIWKKEISNLGNILFDDYYLRSTLIKASNGNLIMASNSSSYGSDIDLYEIDTSGNLIWSKRYEGPQSDRFNALIDLGSDGYLLVGETSSYGIGDFDILLIKVNLDGEEIWKKTYGGQFTDYGRDAIRIEDEIYIIGASYTGQEYKSRRSIILKVDKDGNPL